MQSNVAPIRGKITDWWFASQKPKPPKYKGRGKVAVNMIVRDLVKDTAVNGSKGYIARLAKCTPSTVQKACDNKTLINGRYKVWYMGDEEPVIKQATRGGYYYCFDGVKWIEGQRNVIDRISGSRLHNHMIKGTSLLNRQYAVGHSKKEAIERFEKLKHLQRKTRNGFAVLKITKGEEVYEMTIPEAATFLQFSIATVRTAATQNRLCAGWKVKYVGVYE